MNHGTPQDAQRRAQRTYDAAWDHYDHPSNAFWERYGRRTVERLGLARGAKVLDVCCGSGASALPAARAVGAAGTVLGVDLAENLLALAREKVKVLGLANVEFRQGDVLGLELPDASFDAVVCVFGIFFVPDMSAAARELWRMVGPGGRLAITTWGPRCFEPGNTAFWEAVRSVRPELYKGFNPWDRISEPEPLRALLASAGIAEAEIVPESGTQPLASPEDFWPTVLGSGYRGTLEQLLPVEQERVRRACLSALEASGVRSVETNVVYAVARKGR